MNESRRSILRKASALSALAVGASATASAADCTGVPEWDASTLYSGNDQVQHPDANGVNALWQVAIDSRNAEPSRSSAYWDYVGDCGSGGGNTAPTASFTTDVSTPAPGENVGFDASSSSDSDGSISSYSWEFGDGSSSSGQTASHSYSSAGDYTVTLTVTDDAGATGTASQTVSVSSGTSNQAPNASFTVAPSSPTAGESATFDAADSSDTDGSISSYSWEFGDGSSATGQSASHTFGSTGDYTVTLTVTDDDGATDSNATTVTVQSSGGGGTGVDCSGVSAYDSSATYTGGDQVTYDGSLWTAEWWTQGTAPAESENVWTLEGSCSGNGGGGGNEAPVASFTSSPVAPDPGEQVTFDASGSSDPDGDSLTYSWEFGDGSTGSGATAGHTYSSAGDYTVTLTVSDGNGNSATDTTTLSVATGGGTGGNRIVGYWMQWAQYDREYVPADVPKDQVTHLQYAFMAPEPDGTISGLGGTSAQKYLFPQSWHDVTSFGDISSNTDVTCLISIGGWSDSENFSDVALNESSRQTFADECVRIVREAGVDGVDVDWEYPGGGGHPDNTVREGDQERFTLLIQAVRDALDAAGAEDGKDYKLTAAVVADPAKAQGLEHGTLSDLFDFVSVMTFDMRGGFSDYTGHASPIFQNPNDPSSKADKYNVDHAMSWWADQGWDPGQLNMATPFYGRSFASVQPPSGGLGNGTDDGLFQNFSGTGEGSFPPDTSASGIYDYWDLSTVGTERATSQVDLSSSAWTTSYDDTAKAAWSYNQGDSLMISHPTPDSVQTRANWLANTDYGGTMIWALSHDTVEHHLLDELSNGLL